MCELFAISSRIKTDFTSSLREFSLHGGKTGPHNDGWGVAIYNGHNAKIIKEPQAAAFSRELSFLQSHHRSTSCGISHIRRATIGEKSWLNTQPFIRELAGYSHVFAHNGNLEQIEQKFTLDLYQPEGETDSEYAFCYLMAHIAALWQKREPTLQQRISVIEQVFTELALLGPANFLYSDGTYLYAFANKRFQPGGKIEPPGMFSLTRQCCENNSGQNDPPICRHQKIILFASIPLTKEAWQPLPSYRLIVTRQGAWIRQ